SRPIQDDGEGGRPLSFRHQKEKALAVRRGSPTGSATRSCLKEKPWDARLEHGTRRHTGCHQFAIEIQVVQLRPVLLPFGADTALARDDPFVPGVRAWRPGGIRRKGPHVDLVTA